MSPMRSADAVYPGTGSLPAGACEEVEAEPGEPGEVEGVAELAVWDEDGAGVEAEGAAPSPGNRYEAAFGFREAHPKLPAARRAAQARTETDEPTRGENNLMTDNSISYRDERPNTWA
jgi:hypothetical protein